MIPPRGPTDGKESFFRRKKGLGWGAETGKLLGKTGKTPQGGGVWFSRGQRSKPH